MSSSLTAIEANPVPSPKLHPRAATIIIHYLPTQTEIQACWELCRLHNNIGFWVVWLPTAWSIAMVYYAQPETSALVALTRAAVYVPLCFGIKSLIMTIDDILDSDIDGFVERTKNRALPRGAISLKRAWLFFILQVTVGIYLAFNYLSTAALRVSMLVWPLYLIYPTCKRWMYLAPIPLGLMFNIGVFMGWGDLTVNENIPWRTLAPVYIGSCLWTITYETVYQHQDKADDIKIGIRSAALLCGEHTILICTGSALGFLGLLSYGGYLNGHGPVLYASILCAGILLIPRLWNTDVDCPGDCRQLFLGTPFIGKIILAGFVGDAVIQRLTSGIPL